MLNRFRWKEVSMVFQGAQSALNPIETIYNQFFETMKVHLGKSMSSSELKTATQEKFKELMDLVNLDY